MRPTPGKDTYHGEDHKVIVSTEVLDDEDPREHSQHNEYESYTGEDAASNYGRDGCIRNEHDALGRHRCITNAKWKKINK